MNEIFKRAANLLTVKSIVTVTLTAVFAGLSVSGSVGQEFLTIYTVIIGFYFGTQTGKKEGVR